jgi:hypothetical protein
MTPDLHAQVVLAVMLFVPMAFVAALLAAVVVAGL